MNNIDFISEIDFTGYPQIQGADINAGIANGTPLKDTDETVGKSINLTTTDSALDTPTVPDPATSADYTKWKRYLWIRRPFAGAPIKSAKLYVWNDDTPTNGAYLKWLEISIDLTTLTASVNNALASAATAVAVAGVANDTANLANATANASSALATTANTAANNAVTTANTANTLAGVANTTANAAQLAANNAVTLNTTPIAINQRLLPSATAQQEIRVSADLSKVEWFSPRLNILKFSETYIKNTDNPSIAAGGANIRLLNTIDTAGSGQLTLNAGTGVLTVVTAGYYRFNGLAVINRSGASAVTYQLFLIRDGSPISLAAGISGNLANGNTNNMIAVVQGTVFLFAGDTIHLDMYISSATGVVFGKAANLNPDVGGKEVYSVLEFEFLGN